MARENSSYGLNISDDVDFTCEACIYGKQKRSSHKTQLPKDVQPGEFIHSDVCGSFEELGLNGEKYFVVFKDEASSYRMVYCLQQKSEVVEVFARFANGIKNKFNRDIKWFQSDCGTEYTCEEFRKLTTSRGIDHRFSAPYTPQQNGTAEREIRNIMESARSMLYGRKNVPKNLWPEAVKPAAEVLNRVITKKSGNKTLHEIWTGKKADIRNLHVFGSVAYAHVPDSQRRKLDKKSRKVLFVGYEKLSDNYRLYDLTTKKVFVSAHVNFTKEGEEENKYLFSLVRVGGEEAKANDNLNKQESSSSSDNNGSETESSNESSTRITNCYISKKIEIAK